jgi:hypothetical protein
MVCPKCRFGSLVVIPAEVRLYRNSPRTLSHPPMTPSPDVRVCVDCGWAEFVVPEEWLSAGWLGTRRANIQTNANGAKPIVAA